jgi:AcrR family transcriptional regulator
MQAATRALRARIADTPGIRPPLSPREIDRRNAILRAATTLMADFPPSSFTLTQFAIAIETSPATIRRHFVDLDGVLAEILGRHLLALATAIGQIAHDRPDRAAACRAAYLAYTRTPVGGLTQEHLLFTRDRFSLPPEDRARLEAIHLSLGEELGGLSAQDVLSLLDCPVLEQAEIEGLLATRAARAAANIRLAATAPPLSLVVQEPPAPPPPHATPQPAGTPPVPDENDWMPSPSLYARHMEAMRARAGP